MVMAGLLWYDDDGRRPLTAKIIEAAERYRERIGFAPTVCQLPPQQWTALTDAVAHPKRSRTPAVQLPRSLRLESDEHLSANYFLLGMGEDDLVIPNPLLAPDDPPVRARRGRNAPRARQSDQPLRTAQRAPAAQSAASTIAEVETKPLSQTPKPRKTRTAIASVTPPTQEAAVSAPASAGARAGHAPKLPAPPAPVADVNVLKPRVRDTKPTAKITAKAKPSGQKTTGKTTNVTLAAVPRPVEAKKAGQSSAEKPVRQPANARTKATKLVPSTPHKAKKGNVAQVSLWDLSAATVNTRKRSSRVDVSTPAAASPSRAVNAPKTPDVQQTSVPRETFAKAAKIGKAKTTRKAARTARTASNVRDTSPTSAKVKVAPANALPVKAAKMPKSSRRSESESRAPSRVAKTTAPKSARKASVAPKAAKSPSARSRGAATPSARKPTVTKARAKATNAKPTSVPKAAATPATRKSPASGSAQAAPPPQTTTRRRLAKSA